MKKDHKDVSMAVIRRLPKYHRRLKELMEKDVTRISSKELSGMIGFTASQIRQDLNCFGGFGQQGYGYDVSELYTEISRILGLTEHYNTVIVGAGNLGQAIANYSNFEKKGFHVLALFEKNPRLIGLKIRDVPVLDIDELEEFAKNKSVDIGVICTNSENAQDVADQLVKLPVKAVWNFAPVDIILPENIVQENVHLSDSLFVISYLLKMQRDEQQNP
ncbi:redox-sensing transcriptional repressor Rex [Tindallia californiensis]|uniref:Redox-sensing transcriptional repressor Rex n=1 Tax=Tindallia californiensis TaxID=159292 RepID=A0A1H3L7J3_9FIRM|nr:redox-sensing transcriptional repressor Rex [Tindallia californiensis]SDY60236.1 redox-sensing transcriptional repressor [Tindallia californiensis]